MPNDQTDAGSIEKEGGGQMFRFLNLFTTIAVLFCAAPLAAEEIDLDTSPLLEPEHCFKTAPDAVIEELEQAG